MTILEEARRVHHNNPHIRLGQAVYNVAYSRNPAVAQLAGSDVDPFHDDGNIRAFLVRLREIEVE